MFDIYQLPSLSGLWRRADSALERLRNEIRQALWWLRQQTPAPASRRQVPQALLRASFAGLRKWTAELIKPQLACG